MSRREFKVTRQEQDLHDYASAMDDDEEDDYYPGYGAPHNYFEPINYKSRAATSTGSKPKMCAGAAVNPPTTSFM